MKKIIYIFVFIFSLNLTASVSYPGNVLVLTEVDHNEYFLVYYQNYETKKITMQTYSIAGKLIKTSLLSAKPWEHFFKFNRMRKEFSVYNKNIFLTKYPSSTAIISEQKMKGMSYEEREKIVNNAKDYINLYSFLSPNLNKKLRSIKNIFVDGDFLLTTSMLKEGTLDKYLLIFNIKQKKFIGIYKIGLVDDSVMGGYNASRIMKYENGYIIIWKGMSLVNIPNEKGPLFCTYLDMKNKKISKYIISKDTTFPIKISTGLIGDVMCVTYSQNNNKQISQIKIKFVNLKQLLEQKPVSITGPVGVGEHRFPSNVGEQRVPFDDMD